MPDEQPRFTVQIHERARSPFWQARIYLEGEGGRERRWSTGVAIGRGPGRRQSARVAQRKAEEHAAALAAEAVEAPGDSAAAIGEVAKRMIAAKEASGARPRWIKSLLFTLDKHVGPFFTGARDVTTIRRADLEAFKAHLREKGLAAQSINNALTAVRQILHHAWAIDEMLEAVPMVANVPRDLTPKGQAFSVEQIDHWIEQVGTAATPAPISRTGKKGQRTTEAEQLEARHLVEVIANTGIRRDEALSLRFSWIDWSARLIHVPSEATKGGRVREPLVINVVVERALRARLELHHLRRESEDDRVFRRNRRMTREATRGAELAELGPARLHDLRHSLGSLHVQAGATLTEVRDTLGHATMDMVNHYQHAYLEQRREVSERVVLGAKEVIRASDPGAEGPRGEIGQDHARGGKGRKGRRAVGSR